MTHIRALVILPVTDLASQVYKVFQTYAEDTDLKVRKLPINTIKILTLQHCLS